MNYDKPHYRWNGERYVVMASEVIKQESSGVPDWMRKASTGTTFGNIDSSDLRPPRLKVLAGLSPEVMDGVPNAVPGNFWLTILNVNLGKEVTGSPIWLKKTYQLWAPRGPNSEQRGPLASASDGIHWDVPDQTFYVQFPGNPKEYKWQIKKTVFENRMNEFGSSQDDDPASKPAATLTYDVLWLIDMPNGRNQACVFTASKTGTTKTQNFISTIRAMGDIDHFYQRYRIGIQKKTGPTRDPYFTYDYTFLGVIQSEEIGKQARALYEQYSKTGFQTMAQEAEELHAQKVKSWGPNQPDDKEEIPF
jgi:hypothetical protein